MLEPWAAVSKRLRRISSNFKMAQMVKKSYAFMEKRGRNELGAEGLRKELGVNVIE